MLLPLFLLLGTDVLYEELDFLRRKKTTPITMAAVMAAVKMRVTKKVTATAPDTESPGLSVGGGGWGDK